MARVRRGGSPAGSPALSATPTGEGVGKVCVEVGCAGGMSARSGAAAGRARSVRSRGRGLPRGKGRRPALGAPRAHRPPTHAVPPAGTAGPLAPPAGSAPLAFTGMPQSPGGHPCPDQTPACDRSRRGSGGGGGGTARAAGGAGAELRVRAERSRGRRLARSPRARSPAPGARAAARSLARPLSAAARSSRTQ